MVTLAFAQARMRVSFSLLQRQGSDDVDARNRLAALFLAEADASHLLFVDAALAFEPAPPRPLRSRRRRRGQ